ncbi:MAG: ATP-binding cassette domain-containing protein [Candidatus Marinimicrobia bacterium]|nr:ATP-binding cassette domain-containing protein [Candidatus Neomarinimicrobiota bacterium]
MSIHVENISKSFTSFKREAGLKGAFRSFVNRKYETFHALQNINLDVDSGEIIGILGENGAGKTTLIKLMVGLLYPSDGRIEIDGYTPWKRKNEFLKQISVVMGQKNQLWWDIPASESFLLNQKIYEIPQVEYKKTLDELVQLLNVEDKLNVQVRRLSLGERMKMEIIAALLHTPKFVLLDEPTIGLDVISQSKIREFIKYYNEEYDSTFLLTSHYMNDIQALCDRVFVIHKGKGLYDGNFNSLVRKIKPQKKLIFEFAQTPEASIITDLQENFKFDLIRNVVTAELPDKELTKLLGNLFKLNDPVTFSVEELPVEDTMKTFFSNPEKFL